MPVEGSRRRGISSSAFSEDKARGKSRLLILFSTYLLGSAPGALSKQYQVRSLRDAPR